MKSVGKKVCRFITWRGKFPPLGIFRWQVWPYIESPLEDIIKNVVWSNISVVTREQLKKL